MTYKVGHWRGIALLCVFMFVFLSNNVVKAQSQSDDQIFNLRTVSKPSPTAAALGKYVEWPVNLNSGTASINIPLTTLTGRSLEVPVSLSYHSSGIKVNELASWVGLGWSLNAGGVITRTVRGLPDELYGIGYFYVRELAPFENKNYTFYDTLVFDTLAAHAVLKQKTVLWTGQVMNAALNDIDPVPDSYSLNAMGRSYRLIFRHDPVTGTEIQTVPFSNIKIETDHSGWVPGSGEWTVTLEDGTVLKFGTPGSGDYVENTDNKRLKNGAGNSSPSSWYLRSVTASSGEMIKFTYYPRVSSGDMVTSVSFSDHVKWPVVSTFNYFLPVVREDVQNFSTLNLKKIESANGEVQFNLDSTQTRKDFPNQRALKEILIYAKKATGKVLVDKYTFHTRQWAADGGNHYSVPGNPDYLRYRLMLDSISHDGGAEGIRITNVPRWKFAYNTRKLPYTTSYAVDHFGYYNGATSNPHLLPAYTFKPFDDYLTFSGSADRKPNPTYSQAGILTSITYPTKGKSEFTYEGNRTNESVKQPKDTTESLSIHLEQSTSPWVSEKTSTISISSSQILLLEITSTKEIDDDQQGLYVRAQVTGPSTSVTVNDNQSKYFNVTPGTYTLRIYTNITSGVFSASSQVNGVATVHYTTPTGPKYKYAGGLRIASIKDWPGNDSTKAIKRSFEYSEGVSLANLYNIDEPDFYISDVEEEVLLSATTTRTRSSSSQLAGLAATVGYGKVITRYGSNGENGRLESTFSNTADHDYSGVQIGRSPFPEMDTKEYERGLLLSELTYDANGNKLSGKYNQYEFVPRGSIVYYKAYKVSYPETECPSVYGYCGFETIRVRHTNHQVNKILTIDSAFSKSDNSNLWFPTVQRTKYLYNATQYNTNPIRTSQSTSRGDTIVTTSLTPFEKSSIVPSLSGNDDEGVELLKAKNMMSTVLQTKKTIIYGTTNAETHMSTITSYFREEPNNSGRVVSDRVSSKLGKQNSEEVRVNFKKYDPKQNVLEQAKTNDVVYSYVYDYDTIYPIAEVVNAPVSAIAFTSFEADGKGNWSFSGTPLTTEFYNGSRGYEVKSGQNPTISGLPSGNYVVSWWSKSNSILINGSSSNITALMTRRGWTLYEKELISPGSITLTGSGFIDDLRLHPKLAQMVTSTFIPLVGKTSETDAAGNTTYYEYDSFNRLIAIRDDKGNLIKFINYHVKTKSY